MIIDIQIQNQLFCISLTYGLFIFRDLSNNEIEDFSDDNLNFFFVTQMYVLYFVPEICNLKGNKNLPE